jgi:hypothetical protein
VESQHGSVWDAILLGSAEQIRLDRILIDHHVYHCVCWPHITSSLHANDNKKYWETKMHGVINKACMEKFKTLTEEGKV